MKDRKDVALVFIHYPLQMHKFAILAARAADCAGEQNRFGGLVDAIFERQDSLGLKTWISYARDAGVADTNAFAQCVASSGPQPRVDAGKAVATKLGATGTQTVLIQGWRITPPPYESLDHVLDSITSGRPPFDRRGR